jgi:hypothetical protein
MREKLPDLVFTRSTAASIFAFLLMRAAQPKPSVLSAAPLKKTSMRQRLGVPRTETCRNAITLKDKARELDQGEHSQYNLIMCSSMSICALEERRADDLDGAR